MVTIRESLNPVNTKAKPQCAIATHTLISNFMQMSVKWPKIVIPKPERLFIEVCRTVASPVVFILSNNVSVGLWYRVDRRLNAVMWVFRSITHRNRTDRLAVGFIIPAKPPPSGLWYGVISRMRISPGYQLACYHAYALAILCLCKHISLICASKTHIGY